MDSYQWLMFWQLSLKLSNYSVTIDKVLHRILTSLRANCFGVQTTTWELMFVTVLLAVCVPFSKAVHSKQFYYSVFSLRAFPSGYDSDLYKLHLQAMFKGLLVHLDDPLASIQVCIWCNIGDHFSLLTLQSILHHYLSFPNWSQYFVLYT